MPTGHANASYPPAVCHPSELWEAELWTFLRFSVGKREGRWKEQTRQGGEERRDSQTNVKYWTVANSKTHPQLPEKMQHPGSVAGLCPLAGQPPSTMQAPRLSGSVSSPVQGGDTYPPRGCCTDTYREATEGPHPLLHMPCSHTSWTLVTVECPQAWPFLCFGEWDHTRPTQG